jgi:[ribosomal protein S5]-alanine N-acetyltransferase
MPPLARESTPTFGQMITRNRREARAGRSYSWALTLDRRLAGQVTMGAVAWGSARSASIGYWIDSRVAGRGLTPLAVALVCDHGFRAMGIHRIEIVIRPENSASRRVVEKLDFGLEGHRPRFLHIDGEWRDHDVYTMLAEDAPPSLVGRLVARHEDFQ